MIGNSGTGGSRFMSAEEFMHAMAMLQQAPVPYVEDEGPDDEDPTDVLQR